MSAESQKRTMRYSTSAFASRDDLLVVEGVFRLARMSLSASLGQSKLNAFAALHDNPTPAPKHASLSHHNIAKPPHISKVHDVFHLLDASLAREQLDSSSAASARKSQPLILSRRFTKLSINKQTTLPPQQRQQINFICDLPRV